MKTLRLLVVFAILGNDCKVTDEGFVHAAKLRLRMLSITGVPVTGVFLKEFECPETVKKLDLIQTKVNDDTCVHIARCINLTRLNLTGTNISTEGLRHLAALHRLERLDISSTRVRGDGIGHIATLPRLRHLFIDASVLNTESLPILCRMIALDELRFAGFGKYTKEQETTLRRALPDCEISFALPPAD